MRTFNDDDFTRLAKRNKNSNKEISNFQSANNLDTGTYLYIQALDALENEQFIKAIRLYEMAADAGNAYACYEVGSMYEFTPLIADLKKAKKYYKKAADLGHEDAQEALRRLRRLGF